MMLTAFHHPPSHKRGAPALLSRRCGYSLVEITVALTMVSVSLMSIASAAFGLLRSGKGAYADLVANSIVAERLIELRQEFDTAPEYLATYGDSGATFDPASIVPACGESLGTTGVVGRVTATAYTSGPANVLILTVELDYGEADGFPRTAVLESFLRCKNS